MTSSWQNDPDVRPTFTDLRNHDEHNNLCLCFHVRENESLAACSLQISNDLFRCPKSTY